MTAHADDPHRAGGWREPLLLLLLAAVATIPLLGLRDLWHSDEPRYAQVGREIVTGGDWVVMHLNGAVYRQKPPLLFWMEAALGHLFGDVGRFAARLPSALFGIAGVLLLRAWARRLGLAAHATLAAALLATSFGWWWLSQRAAFDVILATWIIAALLCDEIGRERESAGRSSAALRWRLGFAACLGFAVLTKGPPALLFGLLGKGLRAFTAKPTARVGGAARITSALLQLLVFAAVVALWIGPQWARLDFDDLWANFGRQTAGRVGDDAPHSQPPWYYLTTLPVDVLPWSLAWLVGAVVWWRHRSDDRSPTAARPAEARRFLLLFVVALFVLFSSISGKRGLYLVPLQPAIALLTALLLARLAGSAEAARRRFVPIAVVCTGLLAIGGAIVMPRLDAGLTIGPFGVEAKSPRPLGAAVSAAGPDDVVVAFGLHHADSLRFYFELARRERGLGPPEPVIEIDATDDISRLLESTKIERLRDLVKRHGPRLLVVARSLHANALAESFGDGMTTVATVRCDGRDYVLLRPR